jgi:hypothetical protein
VTGRVADPSLFLAPLALCVALVPVSAQKQLVAQPLGPPGVPGGSTTIATPEISDEDALKSAGLSAAGGCA